MPDALEAVAEGVIKQSPEAQFAAQQNITEQRVIQEVQSAPDGWVNGLKILGDHETAMSDSRAKVELITDTSSGGLKQQAETQLNHLDAYLKGDTSVDLQPIREALYEALAQAKGIHVDKLKLNDPNIQTLADAMRDPDIVSYLDSIIKNPKSEYTKLVRDQLDAVITQTQIATKAEIAAKQREVDNAKLAEKHKGEEKKDVSDRLKKIKEELKKFEKRDTSGNPVHQELIDLESLRGQAGTLEAQLAAAQGKLSAAKDRLTRLYNKPTEAQDLQNNTIDPLLDQIAATSGQLKELEQLEQKYEQLLEDKKQLEIDLRAKEQEELDAQGKVKTEETELEELKQGEAQLVKKLQRVYAEAGIEWHNQAVDNVSAAYNKLTSEAAEQAKDERLPGVLKAIQNRYSETVKKPVRRGLLRRKREEVHVINLEQNILADYQILVRGGPDQVLHLIRQDASLNLTNPETNKPYTADEIKDLLKDPEIGRTIRNQLALQIVARRDTIQKLSNEEREAIAGQQDWGPDFLLFLANQEGAVQEAMNQNPEFKRAVENLIGTDKLKDPKEAQKALSENLGKFASKGLLLYSLLSGLQIASTIAKEEEES